MHFASLKKDENEYESKTYYLISSNSLPTAADNNSKLFIK